MSKTYKKKQTKKNKTSKNYKICPIGLKPFEEEFSKTIKKHQKKLSSSHRKKLFVKELITKFSACNLVFP